MAPAIYEAIIDEAHKEHLRVIAHVVDLEDAKAAARAGVDGLAHPPHDTVVDDEFLQLMKQTRRVPVFDHVLVHAGPRMAG